MDYKLNDTVTFIPGPKAVGPVTAVVVGFSESTRGNFLVTKDADGRERKIRPGAVQKAA